MKVAFVLPKPPRRVNGGYRIVYQYATMLCNRGHNVVIYYSCNRGLNERNVPGVICVLIRKILFKKYRWFELDKRISEKVIFDISNKYIEKNDCIFATAIETSRKVNELSDDKGKKFYLIQGIENWGYTIEEVIETYNYNFTNIAISKYLYDFVMANSSNKTEYIPNGLDFRELGVEKAIEDRDDLSIAFLYHKAIYKGCKYSIEVINNLKKKYSKLKVMCFGTCERPEELPDWVEYTQNATRNEVKKIYNDCAIFLCSTIQEGFGLTGAESMACGCAFVSSDYDAVHDYAVDKVNALLSPVKNVEAMEKNVIKLFENPAYRVQLAYKGVEDIQGLDWNDSLDKLERILGDDIN